MPGPHQVVTNILLVGFAVVLVREYRPAFYSTHFWRHQKAAIFISLYFPAVLIALRMRNWRWGRITKDALVASALSNPDFRVEGLEFTAGVADSHLPVDSALRVVDVERPRADLGLERRQVTEPASGDALAGQRT
jgi:hypothetical protein